MINKVSRDEYIITKKKIYKSFRIWGFQIP